MYRQNNKFENDVKMSQRVWGKLSIKGLIRITQVFPIFYLKASRGLLFGSWAIPFSKQNFKAWPNYRQ